jgi:hypothetical protein
MVVVRIDFSEELHCFQECLILFREFLFFVSVHHYKKATFALMEALRAASVSHIELIKLSLCRIRKSVDLKNTRDLPVPFWMTGGGFRVTTSG